MTAPSRGVIQRKVCLVGVPAVGKTSLARRFVEGVFSDDYLTTIGVKIDRREVDLDGRSVRLVVWDIAGDDVYTPLDLTYLRGAAGLLLVADGTRPPTLDRALELHRAAAAAHGDLPAVLALNKADLAGEWALDPGRVSALGQSRTVLETSARTGAGVEAAFETLARRAVGR